MTDVQSPEQATVPGPDPEAPWGRKPDGTPYKRDPGPFAHLRGKPFGSMNGRTPPKRTKGPSGKPRATAAGSVSLAMDAEGYRARIGRWFSVGAKMLSRKAPVDAAIVHMRADTMAAAWGRAAVSYPKLGRFIDRIGKGGDLSDAIASTVTTAVLIAHAHGLTAGTPLAPVLEEAVELLLAEFTAIQEAEEALRNATLADA